MYFFVFETNRRKLYQKCQRRVFLLSSGRLYCILLFTYLIFVHNKETSNDINICFVCIKSKMFSKTFLSLKCLVGCVAYVR